LATLPRFRPPGRGEFTERSLHYPGVTYSQDWHKIIIDWDSSTVNTLAHEIGHGVGIEGDYQSPTTRIMYFQYSTSKNELSLDEAEHYRDDD